MDSGSISNILREFKAAVGTSQLVTRWRLCKMTWKLYPAPVSVAAQTCHWLFRSIRRRNTKKLLKEVNEYLGSSMLPELANISEIIQAVFDSSAPRSRSSITPARKSAAGLKSAMSGASISQKKIFLFWIHTTHRDVSLLCADVLRCCYVPLSFRIRQLG